MIVYENQAFALIDGIGVLSARCGDERVHSRDRVQLTPVTPHLMAKVIAGGKADFDISAFSPARFSASQLTSSL